MDHGGREFRVYLALGSLTVLCLIALLGAVAHAEYDGPTTPEIEAWFRTVRNSIGDVCCDSTEVTHVSDYQWRGDHWDVVVDGVTYHANPDRTTKEPNRLGEPLAWFYPKFADRSDDSLRCFMRGTEG